MKIPKLDYINYNALMRKLNEMDPEDKLIQTTLRQFLETDFDLVVRFTGVRYRRTKNMAKAYRAMAEELLAAADQVDLINYDLHERLIGEENSVAKSFFNIENRDFDDLEWQMKTRIINKPYSEMVGA